MLALLALAFTTNSTLAVTLVTVAVGINAATYLGFQINHLDLAPNHSGTLMGITNCSANIMSIIAPLLVGFILKDPVRRKSDKHLIIYYDVSNHLQSDALQWRIIFFISAGVYFFGNLQFVIFGKAAIQRWNDPEAERKRSKRNNHRAFSNSF